MSSHPHHPTPHPAFAVPDLENGAPPNSVLLHKVLQPPQRTAQNPPRDLVVVRVPHIQHHDVVGEVEQAARHQAVAGREDVRVHAVVGVVEDGEHGEGDDGRGDAQAEECFGAVDAPERVGAGVEEGAG